MAPVNNLAVLAFASAALAVPHAQWQPFKRHAHPGAPPAYGSSNDGAPAGYTSATSSSTADPVTSSWSSKATPSGTGYPISYPAGNGTYPYGSGTGVIRPTGYGSAPGYSAPAGSPSGPAGGYGSSSLSVCTETSTLIYRSSTEYSTYYVTHTVYPSSPATAGPTTTGGPGGYGTNGPVPVGPATESTCAPDVTVTTTEQVTVYVTAGGASSSEASPVPTSPAAPPVYSAPSWSEASTAPSGYSAGGEKVAAHPSGYSAASSTSTAKPTGGSTSSTLNTGFRGKRGLAYNDGALCSMFEGSDSVGWVYDWVSSTAGYTGSLPFIPMLWGNKNGFPDVWASEAQAGLDNGATILFGMNEPDNAGQANMMPDDAAAFWKQYMEPFAGKATLVAPSVTNGNAPSVDGSNPSGTDWLSAFMQACDGCHIDAVNAHWYDYTSNNATGFKSQVQAVSDVAGGLPVFVTEFAAIGSDADKTAFLQDVMPWMDSNPIVAGYSYYMVADGFMVDGTAPTSYASTYMDYSS